jgi:hypothetical protein
MKIIITESQLKKIIKEGQPVKYVDDVNWYGIVTKARNNWQRELNDTINVPSEFYRYVTNILLSLTSNLQDSFENDVKNGGLSKSTIDLFNRSVVSTLNRFNKDRKLNDEIKKIPLSQRMVAKTVGTGKIKEGINMVLSLTGDKFFKEGFTQGLKQYSDVNSPIIKNYIKVSNEMGNYVTNNEYLKNFIYNFIIEKL